MSVEVQITTACVLSPEGQPWVQIERVRIGGGIQTVTVDGVAEDRQHPTLHRWHVRLLSPDRMIPDELRDVETYDEACELALKYATKREEHAAQINDLAAALKI